MAKCAAITSAGTTCKAIPMSGEVYCYVHHPGRKGGKRGGRGRP
jgi:hypothetical protein